MAKDLTGQKSRTPMKQKAGATVVLTVASAVVLVVAFEAIKAIFFTLIIIAAVVGVLWAIKTLVW